MTWRERLAYWCIIIGLTLFIRAMLCRADTIFDCPNEGGRIVGCPVCWGDRDQSRDVTVDEIVTVIEAGVDGCPPTCWGDADSNGEVTMEELQAVVVNALEGCRP